MPDIIRINDVSAWEGKEIVIEGWLYNKRSSGKLHFLQVRDGSGTIQCVVFQGDVSPDVFERASDLGQESSLRVMGTVRADARSSIGFEIGVSDIEIVHCAEDYPITPKEHGTAFLMDHRHLWLRSSRQHAILSVRAEIVKACRDYYDNNGFTLVDAPIFTPSSCEGTSTLFETDYFDERAYLTQSGQLYMEAAAMAFGKVYCFGPTFRAEKSKTRRHLTEFWMVEPEMAYATLDDATDLAEALVVSIVERVLERRARELEVLERDTATLERVRSPFPRIAYDEAVEILKARGFPFEWGGDFGGPDETALAEHFDRPVAVQRFPAAIKAFYMKPDAERPDLSLSVDVLAPEGYGEIVGGGERLDDYALLLERIREHELPQEAFEWYLDLRRYGSVPHAGFGMGIERVVAWLCGIEHIRETIPYPRMLYRLTP
jgi:asparaginyl-tRNA synthetase